MELRVDWQGKMAFSGTTPSGHPLIIDAKEEVGGENRGIRPMEMLLGAVVGCAGMDIIFILKKMELYPKAFKIEAKGERATSHPQRFTDIFIHFSFTGDFPNDKVFRAVELSLNKYCPVAYSIHANIHGSYSINGGKEILLNPEMGGL